MHRRSNPNTFAQHLSDEKARIEALLKETKLGPQHDLLIGKLQKIERASRIDRWLTSKELQPPT